MTRLENQVQREGDEVRARSAFAHIARSSPSAGTHAARALLLCGGMLLFSVPGGATSCDLLGHSLSLHIHVTPNKHEHMFSFVAWCVWMWQ